MGLRTNLQKELESLLGSANVYFQPPSSYRLKYPCIVYERSPSRTLNSDNRIYKIFHHYTVKIIYTNPDSDLPDRMLESFQYCSHDRHFVADNLYHEVFDLYY